MASRPWPAVSRLALRAYVASAWLYASPELDADASWIVVAPHQSALDLAAAAVATESLGRRFAVWAHPDILRVAPLLHTADLLEAPDDPAGFRHLVRRSRAVLRGDRPAALWVFPQGGFFHRSSEPVVHPGIGALVRSCPEIPVVAAGIDYSLYRTGRPHCVIELTPVLDRCASIRDVLVEASRRAGERAAADLPTLAPPKLPLDALSDHANRWRRRWTHVPSER